MSASSPPRRGPGGRLPLGLLGMLVLMAAVERGIASQSLWFTRPESWDWRLARSSAQKQGPRCQVLCFGTSRLQQAIVPQVVEERSGLKAWNLASCWGQAPAYYYLLRQAIDAGARPRAVVVEFHPQCLAGDVRQALALWPELLNPLESLDLAWTARDANLLASTVLAGALPSVNDRGTIRTNILAALRGEKPTTAWMNLAYIRNKRMNRGSIINIPNTTFRGDLGGPIAAGLLGASWACHPDNEVYVRRFLDLAASRSIAVYWLLPPFCPELQARRERKGLDAAYARFAQGFVDAYPNLVVLDAQRSGYEAGVFLDPAHVDRRAATTLSADVGDVLARARTVPPTRWLALPEYRDVAPASPVEDLRETQVAMGARAGKLR